MAKGIGLIGNFKGKVGNMVGYKLSDSNTGNSQGIRVYQPIVRNPKTSAQAEQRAKLAPINATYRALKMIIDRGNEGLPYGNKSRLAWLKQAFRAANMPWIIKGALVNFPVAAPLTKGSLVGIPCNIGGEFMQIDCPHLTAETSLTTIGAVSTALKAGYPSLKEGDQITIVLLDAKTTGMDINVTSFIIDSTSTEKQSLLGANTGKIDIDWFEGAGFGSVIVSREGANGEHLRSTASLVGDPTAIAAAPYDATSKTAAIESYKSSASANSDWAEESIQ